MIFYRWENCKKKIFFPPGAGPTLKSKLLSLTSFRETSPTSGQNRHLLILSPGDDFHLDGSKEVISAAEYQPALRSRDIYID
jgi:hypothetical protein